MNLGKRGLRLVGLLESIACGQVRMATSDVNWALSSAIRAAAVSQSFGVHAVVVGGVHRVLLQRTRFGC